jgi:hypothetical protein
MPHQAFKKHRGLLLRKPGNAQIVVNKKNTKTPHFVHFLLMLKSPTFSFTIKEFNTSCLSPFAPFHIISYVAEKCPTLPNP